MTIALWLEAWPAAEHCAETERSRPSHGPQELVDLGECRGQVIITEGTGVLLAVLAVVMVGALAGTAGYAATIGRRQMRRILELTDRLATATDPTGAVDAGQVNDPRLRAGFGRLAERMGRAWTLATIDLLTGALNRQALLARLEDELERAARYQRPCSIVLVDLDHFKRVNDTYGHAAGDAVLREVAEVLTSNVRSTDLVGRYGGEEFMIVMPETDADAAASSAEKLRRLVGSRQVRLGDGHVLDVTLSAGVAGGLGQFLQLDALIRDADAALYSAKSLGRDQVYVFHELEEGSVVRRAAIGPEAREKAMAVGRAAMGAATAALQEALMARPAWAGKPSNMIAEMAVSLARALELPSGEVERVRTASLLHDLGKLAIPDEILTNPGELTDPEWRVVSEHPKIGQVVLEQAGALRDAATIVLHHHEWFDGRGYPHGLSGQEIPVGARIVAIADAYEAMVAGRPYRRAISHDQAIAELHRHAGIQFDPELVRLFSVMFATGVPWLPDEGHDHGHGHPHVQDRRSHGQIHDDLHARRRSASPDAEVGADVAAAGGAATPGGAFDEAAFDGATGTIG
jgi:diguanylate cyclase (GGDEF)-like protein